METLNFIVHLVIIVATVFEIWQWGTLKKEQARVKNERLQFVGRSPSCYACVTEASVTSFSRASANTFCRYHSAHWHLINDLEKSLLPDDKDTEKAIAREYIEKNYNPEDYETVTVVFGDGSTMSYKDTYLKT